MAPPPSKGQYDIRYDSQECVNGWRELGNKAPGNTYTAWELMRNDPAPDVQTDRHHRLKGDLSEVFYKGVTLPQWQYEVLGGGRIWYLVDEKRSIVWLVKASIRHPKETD